MYEFHRSVVCRRRKMSYLRKLALSYIRVKPSVDTQRSSKHIFSEKNPIFFRFDKIRFNDANEDKYIFHSTAKLC